MARATRISRPETGKFLLPAQYQNSRKFTFLTYSKTSHKRTFRNVISSSFAEFARTAFFRTSNKNFFYNQANHKQAKTFYSFITNMLGMQSDKQPFAAW